ncbi:MAG: hypothetical protein NTX43_13780 [Bacteroidetes bacterium]|nr:hypothetical protein [Bacteroidota bacterium]
MNPDEPITITVDIPFLKKYFGPMGFSHKKENHIISKKEYDQVKDFLSKEYGIQDQQTIDNFCYLQRIFGGQSTWASNTKENGPNKEEESWKAYYSDFSKFVKFLEEYNIKKILLKGSSKKTGGSSLHGETFTSPKFINMVLENLPIWMRDYQVCKELRILDSYKKRPGAEVKLSGKVMRVHFFNLLKFLNTLPFTKLKDLSKPEENYFAGMLFYIAGIINPYSEDKSYLSLRDYLVKTMQKYR